MSKKPDQLHVVTIADLNATNEEHESGGCTHLPTNMLKPNADEA